MIVISSLLRLLAARRLISEPISVSTDVADKHARYISGCYLVRRSREGHEMN